MSKVQSAATSEFNLYLTTLSPRSQCGLTVSHVNHTLAKRVIFPKGRLGVESPRMSDFYIPPENIFFQLIGNDTARALFSRTTGNPSFGAHPADDVLTSSWFSLVSGTGSNARLFAIRGRESGYLLFSAGAGATPPVGHNNNPDWFSNDIWFHLRPGTGTFRGMMCLVVPSSNTVITLSRSNPTLVTNTAAIPGVVGQNSDQFFAFHYEDMVVDRIEYDLDLGKIIASTPRVLANQTLHNETGYPQQMIFEMEESVAHTSNFEFSRGITLSVGMTMRGEPYYPVCLGCTEAIGGGVPFIVETEMRVDTSSTETRTYGEEESITQTYRATFPVNAGPHMSVRAVSRVNSGILDVPYTLHLRSTSTGVRATSHGIWRGVSTWDLSHTLTDITPDGTERAHREIQAEAETTAEVEKTAE
ncbi:hemolytic lectin [Mycena galericulata]|nr:hemolytic lectin [Mycena galericulata]